jgi:hypothetical protein
VKRLLAAVVATAALHAQAADAPPARIEKTVQAPHYGDGLFRFFQDQWFDAITGLMVSQHFGRLQVHADEAEVLRGGMLLSYGLHREAGAVFAKLIEHHASPAVRDRAWYFLAKIRYQRGLIDDAEAALAKVERALAGGLEDERQLLAAQLRLARDDYAGASKILEGIQASQVAGHFARFNLGVALVKSGDAPRGGALLDGIGTAKAANEEQRALRDRANVALGFTALQAGEPQRAREVLQRVRLVGPQSNKALLGFGWAAAELKAPQDALVPWTELAGRDAADAAVLEAKIAVPYAYAELGAIGQALDRYNDAVALYEREKKRLDESIAAIRGGALVGALLARNQASGMSGFGAIGSLGDVPAMPHAGHLSTLFAGHDFQEAFKNLRDLHFLDRNLADWAARLAVFDDMLANRRQAYAERLPKVLQRAGELSLPALQQRRDTLAAELARAEGERDAAAFANPREQALLQRLQGVQQALAADKDADAELVERARRVAGALTWELSHELPDRLWQGQKALRGADAALTEAKLREAALARAQQEEPARFERFAVRIAELATKVNGLAPVVASLGREQQRALQEMAVAELERQKERLDVYAAQARLAIAQLHDRAQVAGRSDTDAAPKR